MFLPASSLTLSTILFYVSIIASQRHSSTSASPSPHHDNNHLHDNDGQKRSSQSLPPPFPPSTPDVHSASSFSSSRLKKLTSVVTCPLDQFLDVERLECRQCSACPSNEIVRVPCSSRRDRVCGPFVEFDLFRQSSGSARRIEVKAEAPLRGEDGAEAAGPGKKRNEDRGSRAAAELTSATLEAAISQWRTLALALMIPLSVVCGVVILLGLYVFIGCRRSKQGHKQFLREPELLRTGYFPPVEHQEPEPRYVDLFGPSRARLMTSHSLPIYQEISGGSDAPLFPPVTALVAQKSSSGLARRDSDDHIYFNIQDMDGLST